MIKAIIFDIDGVLLDSFEANFRFFENLFNATGYKPPTRREFMSLFHATMMEVIKKVTGSHSEAEVMRIFRLGSGTEIHYPLELINTPEGAAETLRLLSGKYLLGIMTGRIRTSVYRAPELAELRDFFRAVVSYEDTEKHKPNPEPLLLAAKRLGVHPSECVYVGDVENDMLAARSAGMKFILFSREKVGSADASTSDFRSIPGIVEAL